MCLILNIFYLKAMMIAMTKVMKNIAVRGLNHPKYSLID